ncbi:MAG: DUF5752 family protein [Candidatus Aenigmatarchaeota archaeon]
MAKPVSEEKAFWFCNRDGYIGKIAHSLEEFSDHVKSVPIDSLEFHLREDKNDFEAWLGNALSKKRLSKKMILIKMRGLRGEELRKAMIGLFEKSAQRLDSLDASKDVSQAC